jgi:hypothetical protein
MMISVQVSVYPLRQEHLSPAGQWRPGGTQGPWPAPEIRYERSGRRETEVVFAALRGDFMRVAANGQVVMTVTVSNVCPV